MMDKTARLAVSDELHKELKALCKQTGLKLGALSERCVRIGLKDVRRVFLDTEWKTNSRLSKTEREILADVELQERERPLSGRWREAVDRLTRKGFVYKGADLLLGLTGSSSERERFYDLYDFQLSCFGGVERHLEPEEVREFLAHRAEISRLVRKAATRSRTLDPSAKLPAERLELVKRAIAGDGYEFEFEGRFCFAVEDGNTWVGWYGDRIGIFFCESTLRDLKAVMAGAVAPLPARDDLVTAGGAV